MNRLERLTCAEGNNPKIDAPWIAACSRTVTTNKFIAVRSPAFSDTAHHHQAFGKPFRRNSDDLSS